MKYIKLLRSDNTELIVFVEKIQTILNNNDGTSSIGLPNGVIACKIEFNELVKLISEQ